MANGRTLRAWLTPGAREFFFLAVFASSVLFLWQIIRHEDGMGVAVSATVFFVGRNG